MLPTATTPSLENKGRRELMLGVATATAALAAGSAFAAEAPHQHHHHGAPGNTGLVAAALDCIQKGNACLDHCIELVKQGDTSIAGCMETVSATLPMCAALAKLGSSQSAHLPALAKVCMAVCKDCYDQCEQHQEHAECKACMDACAACINECKKVAA